MRSDVNAIEIAMEGKVEMLKAIHAPEKPEPKGVPLTREALREIAWSDRR